MLLSEASLHYGVDGHDLLALVESGELCSRCFESRGDCEHNIDNPDCVECNRILDDGGFGPTHDGSRMCKSGSIASGETTAHCTCKRCF